MQTWSQERDFARPYLVFVPPDTGSRRLPVFIFLHGNGGHARQAMRAFHRDHPTIAARSITVFPQGYRESWNVVAERSQADDRGFIEEIVSTLANFTNVDSKNFSIMGASNGAALVNQLMIESRMPNVRNYITGVSPLNVLQFDGREFKAKGPDNEYRVAVVPAQGKRLLNISGDLDALVPYEGGPSRAIPAKHGRLAFLPAEESTFVWARHLGHAGKPLERPTRIDRPLEFFSYLGGDVVHCKVNGQGHGAVHAVPERVLLDFLEPRRDSRPRTQRRANRPRGPQLPE
ncbi:MAG: hypothetical protein SFX72_10870 [Isosphaeraceae bacterium]|nr:hypothetical protein [Isosphaeraceae bacterium]